MLKFSRACLIASMICLAASFTAAQQTNNSAPAPKPAPAVDEWGDNFDGAELDQNKWERFTFEGGNGGTLKVENGELRMRGVGGARSGVRSKQTFTGDHFVINATLAKVGAALPEAVAQVAFIE